MSSFLLLCSICPTRPLEEASLALVFFSRKSKGWKLPLLIELPCITIPNSHGSDHPFSLLPALFLSHHHIIVWLVNRFGCSNFHLESVSQKKKQKKKHLCGPNRTGHLHLGPCKCRSHKNVYDSKEDTVHEQSTKQTKHIFFVCVCMFCMSHSDSVHLTISSNLALEFQKGSALEYNIFV